jgi:predicted nucleic acid-binding protein
MPGGCGLKRSGVLVHDVDLILDTDVLIEVLRGDSLAKAWLTSIESQIIGIPILVWMEILLGARDKQEQRALVEDLSRYAILHLEIGDSQKAQQWFEQFHLSHNIGILDCLIAAIPVRLGKPFFTFNLKHFQVVPGLDARVPYQRSRSTST